MLYKLNKLEEDEKQELFDAIPIITILIAGADGKIDEEELNTSKKIAKIRSYASEESMRTFYEKVGEDYANRLERWIKVLPKETNERVTELSARLEKLNPILAKLDQEVGAHYYKSFTSFATHVAKASGGFMGFGSISKEESRLMELPMLTPIEMPEDEA